jgi:hypothetical protein
LGPGRIITADGECQASKRLAMAANVMARDPAALQLRLLQIVVEVAGEQNSTLVMPVPVELLRFFEKMTPAGPAAELSRSLADFGDAEPAEAEAAIEGRPSAAGPDAVPPADAVTMAPVEAPDITVPRSLRTLSKPNGRSRRLQGHGEQAQPGLESGAGLMLPGPGSDPPGLRPPPEAATTALPEPACTPSPSVRSSSASGVPAGRARGVSPRAVTQPVSPGSSYSRSAVPGERVSPSLAVIASALAVTTVRGSSSAGNGGRPRRPWPGPGRTVP